MDNVIINKGRSPMCGACIHVFCFLCSFVFQSGTTKENSRNIKPSFSQDSKCGEDVERSVDYFINEEFG